MNQADFDALVSELKAGNNRSLQPIFEHHADFCINNLVRKTSCSVAEAEDIFMDSILNFREKAIAGRITFMTQIRNYIYTTCLNMYKVRQSQKMRLEKMEHELPMYADVDQAVGENASKQEEQIDLTLRSFKQLDEKCQCILKKYYVEGHSMKEIAKEMGYSSANVAKSLKSRCYKKWMNEVKELQEVHMQHKIASGR